VKKELFSIGGIPAILWGDESDKIYIFVHGKMSRKEYAEQFAQIAESKGYQTLSFDLPEHGERMDNSRCDVWNGMRDLNIIADYVFAKWKHVFLFANSLGAYFSLNAYADRPFEKALFLSPVVDMKWLVEHMMLWSGVTEKELKERKEIETDIDTLRWDYYQYILAHPITGWSIHTAILFGGKDSLQTLESLKIFADNFKCKLTVSPQSEHPFMGQGDYETVGEWIKENI